MLKGDISPSEAGFNPTLVRLRLRALRGLEEHVRGVSIPRWFD